MKRTSLLILALLVIAGVGLVPLTHAGKATRTTVAVQEILPGPTPGDPVDPSKATIVRNDNGVSINIMTSDLDPGAAYSVWVIIFNDGDPTQGNDAVVNLAGGIADRHGRATFSGRVSVGGDFTNPHGSEHHVVVQHHGPAIPGHLHEQFTTPTGGCGMGEPNHGECDFAVQVAIFAP